MRSRRADKRPNPLGQRDHHPVVENGESEAAAAQQKQQIREANPYVQGGPSTWPAVCVLNPDVSYTRGCILGIGKAMTLV